MDLLHTFLECSAQYSRCAARSFSVSGAPPLEGTLAAMLVLPLLPGYCCLLVR